jgi:hypothetical protein
MKLPEQRFQIEKFLDRPDYIRQTGEQLVKDFGMAGEDIEIPSDEDKAYDQLSLQIQKIIHRLMNENMERLQFLLYRVDLNEKYVFRQAVNNGHLNLYSQVADMIIRRELMKVIIRNNLKY